MATGALGIPYIVWAVLAYGVAGLYFVVVPRKQAVEQTEGMEFMVLRWFHPLVWVLLGTSFLLSGFGARSIAGILSSVAFVVYIIYGVMLARA